MPSFIGSSDATLNHSFETSRHGNDKSHVKPGLNDNWKENEEKMKKSLEDRGIDPRASHMLSERSTI